MFRAPWPPVALAALLLALFALQSAAGVERVADAFGLTPAEVAHGRRLETLLTSQFVHLGWAHVGLNALSVAAFGAGVSALFGVRTAGAVAFFGFYLACGIVAGLTEAAAHPHDAVLVAGASGPPPASWARCRGFRRGSGGSFPSPAARSWPWPWRGRPGTSSWASPGWISPRAAHPSPGRRTSEATRRAPWP